MKIEELNRLYSEGETADKDVFAEQRSNILLVLGEHYSKKTSKFWTRIKDAKGLSDEQKLRLTKNHIQKIAKTYVNNITSYAPGVAVLPHNESELQDQKAAELNEAVWLDIQRQIGFKKRRREWATDFINLGEVFVKVFFDPNAGEYLGDEVTVDENGEQTTTPKFRGQLVVERHFGYNTTRAAEAKSIDESDFLCFRKMVPAETLKAQVGNDPEKRAFISSEKDQTYVIFDGKDYTTQKDMVCLREFYFRPCQKYPRGYFVFCTQLGILWEGELPFGIFPIAYTTFDEIQNSARGRSIIKQVRPYQVEINRAASKHAEHQITLGDDKVLVQSGTKLAQGGLLPGIRGVQYTGQAPTILPGRSGEQYLSTITQNIDEMYRVANVMEDSEEKTGQFDPTTLLFRSMRDRKRFSNYAEKFEDFLIDVATLCLELKRKYCSDEEVIRSVGRAEAINISEFKNTSPLAYQIKLVPQTDDVESKMGKYMACQNVLQYAGGRLEREDLGKLLSMMPYVNEKQLSDELTINYRSANNVILALERGDYPKINQFDDHPYMIRRLTQRTREADYPSLHPFIQQNYERRIAEHEAAENENQRKIIAAKSEYIPTDDQWVKCDLYVPDQKDPMKQVRATFPAASLKWLRERLMDQGNVLEPVLALPESVQAHMVPLAAVPQQGPMGPMQQGPMGPMGEPNV